jgi:hypothetical protein
VLPIVAGFFIASYALGALPGLVKVSSNKSINSIFTVLWALAAWAIDKWLLSPRIDQRLKRSRGAHFEANLGDIHNAFDWALMCRVYSSKVHHEMLDSSNKEYEEVAKMLSDPAYPIGGIGLTDAATPPIAAQRHADYN